MTDDITISQSYAEWANPSEIGRIFAEVPDSINALAGLREAERLRPGRRIWAKEYDPETRTGFLIYNDLTTVAVFKVTGISKQDLSAAFLAMGDIEGDVGLEEVARLVSNALASTRQ